MRMFSMAILLACCQGELAIGAEAITDQQWGETRCDLVAQENREPCMAAHARLGIVPDRTLASVTASANASPVPADEHSTDVPEVARAKKLVADNVKDPTSVLFKDVVYRKENLVVCGQFNAKNSYGAYAGYEDFVVGPDDRVRTFNGKTNCAGSPSEILCLEKKVFDMRAIKANCLSSPEPRLPDDPKELRARVDKLSEEDGAMSWVMQEDAMTWLERNQTSTDADVVKAMVDLCGLMSNRGSKLYAARLAVIEKGAANKKVRSECEDAREEVEGMN